VSEATGDSAAGDLLGGLSLQQCVRIARRRKWWIVLTAIGMTVTAMVLAWRLPNVYRAQTTILVDPQKVPDNYVPSTVTSTVADRLATLTQQIMSPSLLKRIREEMHLYPDLAGNDDRVTKKMQHSIAIDILNGGRQISAFQISFTHENPEITAEVTNELAAALIRENLKVRQAQFSGTAEFLDGELQDTKKQLEDKEHELAAIKSKFVMDLPESKQFHLEALSNLRLQLQTSQDRVSRDQQEKVYLQSLMSTSHPTVDLDTGGSGTAGSPGSEQIQKLQTHLAELRTRYGPNFPDVRKAQVELDRLKAKAAQDAKDQPPPVDLPSPPAATRNPVIDAQINKVDQDTKEQIKLQHQLQEQIDFHASKLEHEPVFEQQISGLMRDYDTLRIHYDRLLDKKLSAEMAADLESHQRGENFVILDRAIPPLHPISPNRPLIALAGLVGGLLAGLGLAIIVELTSDLVRDEREAADIYRGYALAAIPYVANKEQLRLAQARLFAAVVVVIVAATVLGLGISYVFERLV
jgi:polysaccharide biosynthesis transport protein